MDPQEETEIKNIIRSILISNPLRSTQQQLWRDFQEMIGRAIPFRKLGFNTFDEYLRSIPDVVRVYSPGPLGEVEGVSAKSQHINEMVLKQKVPNQRKRFGTRHFSTVQHKPSRFYQNRSDNIKFPPSNKATCKSILELPMLQIPKIEPINTYTSPPPKNISQPTPQSEEKTYKPNLHFNHKSGHQEENNKSPVTSLKKTEVHISSNKSQTNSFLSNQTCDNSKDKKVSAQQSLPPEIDRSSQVPIQVQNNLRNLMQIFPEGIECTRLPAEYRETYRKNIHYEDYGYRSLIEMCSDLPKIFNYIQHASHDYMLYDKKRPVPTQDLNQNSTKHVHVESVAKTHILEDLPNVNWKTTSALLPADVLTINDEISRLFPSDVQEDDILDITIGEIYDLSKFWFYITFGELDSLMDDLQTFFSKNHSAYLIPELLLEEGLYCVALYSDMYHRCCIVDPLPKTPNCVRVFFLDYGTVENVNSREIWFLPKKFGKVPGQAMRGRLSNIYPAHENQPWSTESVRRFEQLITKRVVVGKVTRVDEKDHFLELYLADITNKDEIFYLNKIFVDEGYALYVGDERKKSLVDHDCIPNVRYLHLYPEFYEIEAGMAPTTEERKYIYDNKIPMHHYMPQYFDIYYNEDINGILLDYDRIGRKRKKNLIIPIVQLEFDFSIFPDYLVDEIKELYLQDHPEVETSKKIRSVKSRNCDIKIDSKSPIVKNELNTDGEKKTNESAKEYFCNKKRISEIRQGTTSADKVDTNDNKNFCDNSFVSKSFSDWEHSETMPLANTLQQLSVNGDSSINSVSPPQMSTNPFGRNTINTNPFRPTNPFLIDLESEESVNTSHFRDFFTPPTDENLPHKIVNNLKNSRCKCNKDKQVNIEKSALCSSHDVTCNTSIRSVVSPITPTGNCEPQLPETPRQRVRTPPGFNSSNTANRMPVPQVTPNNIFFNSAPRGNPYYQRIPFGNAPLQPDPLVMPYVVPMQGNYLGCVPPMYANPYNFNGVNWPQMFPQQNFSPPRYPH